MADLVGATEAKKKKHTLHIQWFILDTNHRENMHR